jgi:hypothetical protein
MNYRPSHTRCFIILLGHSAGLVWTSDQPIAKVSTYIGQHNTEKQRQTSTPQVRFEPTTPVTKPKTYTLDCAATGTGL